MKIALASDVHLEFGPITLENTDNADVLILSGDICVAADLFPVNDPYGLIATGKYQRFLEFFETCSKNFPEVVYVMGNHEHYHGDFAKTAKILRDFLKPFTNIHFLDKEFIELHGHIIYGGTMWTNFDMGDGPGNQSAMRTIKGMMNDYRGVKNSNRMVTRTVPIYKTDADGKYVMEKNALGYDSYVEIGTKKSQSVASFSPEDSYEDHQAYIKGLTEAMASRPEMKFVVVGHHAPSKLSTHPRYAKEVMINTAYSSDLTEFILNNPQIKVWTHGHTHEPFDYMIGTTRIVCNPRGYDGCEQRAYDFKLQTFEV
jgi:predicted phosphodiesterase